MSSGLGDRDAPWMSLGFNQMPFDDNEDAITSEEMVPSCVPDSFVECRRVIKC